MPRLQWPASGSCSTPRRRSARSIPIGSRRPRDIALPSPSAAIHQRTVDATYVTLLDSGGTSLKEPWDAFWGMRYAEVKDPDGNVVDLFADL